MSLKALTTAVLPILHPPGEGRILEISPPAIHRPGDSSLQAPLIWTNFGATSTANWVRFLAVAAAEANRHVPQGAWVVAGPNCRLGCEISVWGWCWALLW